MCVSSLVLSLVLKESCRLEEGVAVAAGHPEGEEVGVEEDHQAWLLGEEAEVAAEEVEEVGERQQLRAVVEAGAGGEAQALPG